MFKIQGPTGSDESNITFVITEEIKKNSKQKLFDNT